MEQEAIERKQQEELIVKMRFLLKKTHARERYRVSTQCFIFSESKL